MHCLIHAMWSGFSPNCHLLDITQEKECSTKTTFSQADEVGEISKYAHRGNSRCSFVWYKLELQQMSFQV